MNASNNNHRSRGRGSNQKNHQRGRNSGKHSAGNRGGGRGGNKQPQNINQAKQMLDKYTSQARDMAQSGDRVAAEGLRQHAEHYQRVYNELSQAQAQNKAKQNKEPRQNHKSNNEGSKAKDADTSADGEAKKTDATEPSEKPTKDATDAKEQPKQEKDGASEASDEPAKEAKPKTRRKRATPAKTVAAE